MKGKILIVDDEPNITASFSSLLTDEGFKTSTALSAEKAMEQLARSDYDILLLDLNLPGLSGIDLLDKLHTDELAPIVLVISGQTDIPMALEAIQKGATDYLEKPVEPEKLISAIGAAMKLALANRQRFLTLNRLDDHSKIIGKSRAVRQLMSTIRTVAPSNATVLITGENGTGKELVATRLHLESKRREKPFIKVNCPGVPPSLFESELFGHTKGSFTGAVRDFPGRFMQADGGTLFLDEIGDLPLECQAKLLRVLESGEVETIGSVERQTVDVRVLCATNRNLTDLIQERTFREDLFYRISVMSIEVPPLRNRRDDIPLLIGTFLSRFDPSGRTNLTPEGIAYISTLPFPGNVRQLKNLIERLTILHNGKRIPITELYEESGLQRNPQHPNKDISLSVSLSRFEKHLIESALIECKGNISRAAKRLGVDRANLSRKIKELDLKNYE